MNDDVLSPDDATRTFTRLRPRLQGIAYRMLGTVAEAEEVVQDAWLRWHEVGSEQADNAEAWLVSVTTRLAIDRLRTAKLHRERYAGLWLPEPMLTDAPHTPEEMLERADDMSVALLMVLERLSPEARAAFLLREVFEADYADLARTIGKSEAACRQLVHRAKTQVSEARPRYVVPPDAHQRVLQGFAAAVTRGDFAGLRAMLDDEAELIGDGGGRVPSFPKPMLGGQRIAQLFYAAFLRHGEGMRLRIVNLNGEWGLLRFFGDTLESAQTFETDGERIFRIQVQRNPLKLARIVAALRAEAG
jgi:RNA polymerase sigma-70 factor (ECF subfamily)